MRITIISLLHVCLCAGLGLSSGCATFGLGAKKADSSSKSDDGKATAKKPKNLLKPAERMIDTDDFEPGDFRKRDSDLNSDQNIDVTEYFFIKNEEEILVRKEVDVNFDKSSTWFGRSIRNANC